MNVEPYYYGGSTAPTGWTCSNCGSWVANGVTHICTWNLGTYSPPVRLTDEEIERIARKVAELLRTKKANYVTN